MAARGTAARRPGSVVYVSYEGDALGLRLQALHDTADRRLEHVYIIRPTDPLSPIVTRDGSEVASIGEVTLTAALGTLRAELAAAGRPPIVLPIIDTVRQSMSGNENDSESVSAYLRAVRRVLATLPGAGCILAHHAGWQDGEDQRKRERGSSAWRGNCDATLYLEAGDYNAERGEATLTLRTLKVRDAERPAPLHLVRRRVELAAWDADGRPLTSCIIERDLRTRDAVRADADRAVAAEQRAVDLAVLRAIRDSHITSQSTLRSCVGLQRDVVNASLARVLHLGHVEPPGRQRHPYSLTPIGARIADEGTHRRLLSE